MATLLLSALVLLALATLVAAPGSGDAATLLQALMDEAANTSTAAPSTGTAVTQAALLAAALAKLASVAKETTEQQPKSGQTEQTESPKKEVPASWWDADLVEGKPALSVSAGGGGGSGGGVCVRGGAAAGAVGRTPSCALLAGVEVLSTIQEQGALAARVPLLWERLERR